MAQLLVTQSLFAFLVVIVYPLQRLFHLKQYLLAMLLLLFLCFVGRIVVFAGLHLMLTLLNQIVQQCLVGNFEFVCSQLDQLQEM